MAKQVSRNSNVPEKSLLVPFDITKFGSPDDPCFGKEYDLNSDECQICGDIELCSIAMMQSNTRLRMQLEAENKYKDLEEISMIKIDKVRAFIKEKRAQGWGDTKIIIKATRQFVISKSEVKTLLNK